MARPTKYTPQRAGKIIDLLRRGNTRQCAAGCAGVDQASFYRWMRRFASFAEAVACAEADAERMFAATIQKAATGEAADWKAAESWLKRRRRQEWGDSIDVRKLDADQVVGLLNLAAHQRGDTARDTHPNGTRELPAGDAVLAGELDGEL